MKALNELLDGIKTTNSTKEEILIRDIIINSEEVEKGSLFVCIKGGNLDGHKFMQQAQDNGAVAIICESRNKNITIPQIVVRNSRRTLSLICKNFYDNAVDKLKIIGIVGTNGKTTTAKIIGHILNTNGIKCGVIGTLGCSIGSEHIDTDLTTPDPMILHRLFKEMVDKDATVAVIEVSAHAIHLEKLYGIKLDIGILTNITRDHLDYFHDMKAYADCKCGYFSSKQMKLSVLNSDCDYLGKIMSVMDLPSITYGINNPSDVFAIDIQEFTDHTTFILNAFDELYDVNIKLIGKHNVSNVLGAVTACKMFMSLESIAESLSSLDEIDGRFNVMSVDCVADSRVIIDFAHTEDGLANLLNVARRITNGELITVFGCGGNRDRGKRKIMGQIADNLADHSILTNDNPRNENPLEIIQEIAEGFDHVDNYEIIVNRQEAIAHAIKNINVGDTIIIAGKGAETTMEIAGEFLPFNDKIMVKKMLEELQGE